MDFKINNKRKATITNMDNRQGEFEKIDGKKFQLMLKLLTQNV